MAGSALSMNRAVAVFMECAQAPLEHFNRTSLTTGELVIYFAEGLWRPSEREQLNACTIRKSRGHDRGRRDDHV
jgi:hypothetical protein